MTINTYQDTPEEIKELCERCITHIKNRFNLELDFTPDTLSMLDYFIEEVINEESGTLSTLPPGDKRRAHVIHLLAPTIGAYFGEVIRRAFTCRWRYTDKKPEHWLLEFEGIILRFNPAGAVADCILKDDVETWGGILMTSAKEAPHLKERLGVAPPIALDQYYALTTKLEVIQIADEYLRERVKKNGPINSSTTDYDREFGLH